MACTFGTRPSAPAVAATRPFHRDYKKVTGSSLMLRRYETGSSWIYLCDALVALKSSGAGHVLPSLADSLEAAGRFEIARIVQRYIGGTGRATVTITQ